MQLTELATLLKYHNIYYTISAGNHPSLIEFRIEIELEDIELPEILKPHAYDGDIDRAIYKGNASKQTYMGAEFELALTNYISCRLARVPEVIAIEQEVLTMTTLEEFKRYEQVRQLAHEALMLDPTVRKLQEQLDRDFV